MFCILVECLANIKTPNFTEVNICPASASKCKFHTQTSSRPTSQLLYIDFNLESKACLFYRTVLLHTERTVTDTHVHKTIEKANQTKRFTWLLFYHLCHTLIAAVFQNENQSHCQ